MRNPDFLAFSSSISLIIFLFIVPIQARNQCSSSCGDIEKISYPFRLKGDPADCGDPDYELYCENNRTILNFHAGLYYVKRISYDERVIRLVDVNLAGGRCSLPYRSLDVGEVLGDGRYDKKYLSYHATFVRCSEEIENMANNTVPCLMNNNSSRVYLNYSDYMLYYVDIPSSCNIISMVLAADLVNEKLNFPSNYEAIKEIMQLGFDLNWTVECRDCRNRGGYCSQNSDQSFRCNKEEDYATLLLKAILYLLAVFLVGLILFARFILAPLAVFAFILHKFLYRPKMDKLPNGGTEVNV